LDARDGGRLARDLRRRVRDAHRPQPRRAVAALVDGLDGDVEARRSVRGARRHEVAELARVLAVGSVPVEIPRDLVGLALEVLDDDAHFDLRALGRYAVDLEADLRRAGIARAHLPGGGEVADRGVVRARAARAGGRPHEARAARDVRDLTRAVRPERPLRAA